jgi:non-homologous end joining protein Ku
VISRLALRSRRRAARVGPYSRGIIKAEVEFEREKASREAVKVIKHFIDVKSSGRLSERAMPKNRS